MEGNKDFEKELKNLLSKKASEEEKHLLLEWGFNIKKPTRLTVLAAVVYDKAASGDLSSIKEILSFYKEDTDCSTGVILVDDISKKAQ